MGNLLAELTKRIAYLISPSLGDWVSASKWNPLLFLVGVIVTLSVFNYVLGAISPAARKSMKEFDEEIEGFAKKVNERLKK